MSSPALPVLPIAPFRAEILSAVARNTVTIVKGDTGSGKSSQLPQYLLEASLLAHAAATGGAAGGAAAAARAARRGAGAT